VEEDNQNMNNQGSLPRQGGVEWKSAVQIFTQVSVWIVVPILLALFVGKGLDEHFGTKPIIFLVLAGVGFLFSCYGIVRVIQKYMKEMKDLANDNNQKKN
jgi:F0F1-type ATP synthase assembly protein I